MTDHDPHPREVVDPAEVARVLRNPVRRAVLAVVLERDTPVPIDALVQAVTKRRAAFGIDADAADRSLRVALHHRHVPSLVLADLLSRRGDAVVAGDHRLLACPALDASTLCDDGADWDALAAIFGQPRRRVAVSVLADVTLPLSLSTLARAVAAERVGDIGPTASVLSDFEIRFHHVDLPLLEDAGVVTYDAADYQITAVSKPSLPVPVDNL